MRLPSNMATKDAFELSKPPTQHPDCLVHNQRLRVMLVGICIPVKFATQCVHWRASDDLSQALPRCHFLAQDYRAMSVICRICRSKRIPFVQAAARGAHSSEVLIWRSSPRVKPTWEIYNNWFACATSGTASPNSCLSAQRRCSMCACRGLVNGNAQLRRVRCRKFSERAFAVLIPGNLY